MSMRGGRYIQPFAVVNVCKDSGFTRSERHFGCVGRTKPASRSVKTHAIRRCVLRGRAPIVRFGTPFTVSQERSFRVPTRWVYKMDGQPHRRSEEWTAGDRLR